MYRGYIYIMRRMLFELYTILIIYGVWLLCLCELRREIIIFLILSTLDKRQKKTLINNVWYIYSMYVYIYVVHVNNKT